MNRFSLQIFCVLRSLFIKSCVLAVILIFPAQGQASSDLIGSPAPGFALPDVQGAVVGLDSLRGRVVFLNFWATWCVSCRAELAELQVLSMKYSDAGFDVIGICVDGSGKMVSRFLKKVSITFPMLLDYYGKAADAYWLTGLPASFILDREGIVRYQRTGFDKGSLPVYEAEIKELLKQK